MKVRTLSLLTGVSVPLITSTVALAGFTSIVVYGKANPYGLLVCNVYAEFDRPGEDRFHAVAGTASSPMLIQVNGGGTFYNHQFENVNFMAPNADLVEFFPSLAFDSFVTIGVKSVGVNGQPMDELVVTPGFPGISGSFISTTNSGWAVTPNLPQSDPFNTDYVAGDGHILIGQFATANGQGMSGTFLIQYTSNGQIGQSVVSFFSDCGSVPTPGLLAMMGLAGLIGTRRRRRQ